MVDVDLGELGLDRGGHLLLKRALAKSDTVRLAGRHPDLEVQVRAWARTLGHRVEAGLVLTAGTAPGWRSSGRASQPEAVADPRWGLALRGARVDDAVAALDCPIVERDRVWTDDAPRIWAQAAAAQWDPATAIPWDAPADHPPEVEDAVVQLMTYLVENETVAMLVPAAFMGRIHPHFREVLQVLAVQVADEARHIEVFARRASRGREVLGLSTAGGQASLRTLLEEPDFAVATFLLSVLGEGSFLNLLRFVVAHAPDPVTAAVCRLAAVDEARHVAFGMAHLARHGERDPGLRARMAAAVTRRHDALRATSGLNADVFDALVLLAAGSFTPEAIARGWDAVTALVAEMDDGRRVRLRALGFGADEAAGLSSLHTRNFM
jgi:hypothetical protein